MRRLIPILVVVAAAASACQRFDVRKVERTHQASIAITSKLWFDESATRLFAQERGVVRVWATADGSFERRIDVGMQGPVGAPDFVVTPDASHGAVFRRAGAGGKLSFFDADPASPTWTLDVDRALSLVGMAGNERVVARLPALRRADGTSEPARLRVFAAGSAAARLDVEVGDRAEVALSPDGRRAAVTRTNGIVVFDVVQGTAERTIPLRSPREPRFSDDGTRLVAQESNVLRIVDASSGADAGRIDIGGLQLETLAFPGDLLARTSLSDQWIRYRPNGAMAWRWHLRGADGRDERIWRAGVARDANVVVASIDRNLVAIDPTRERFDVTLCDAPCYGPSTDLVDAIAVSPDGRMAAVAAETTIVLWPTARHSKPVPLRDPALTPH